MSNTSRARLNGLGLYPVTHEQATEGFSHSDKMCHSFCQQQRVLTFAEPPGIDADYVGLAEPQALTQSKPVLTVFLK